MIGYYPQREEGELLYSTTARAAAMMYPGKSARYVADRILGDGDVSFGGLFPNNAALLMRRTPSIAGLTQDVVLDGSAYHLIAPFLDEPEREKLVASMFTGGSTGARRWFTRSGNRRLRYCIACARRDADSFKPATWRVVANHPACSCCDEHGCRLTETPLEFDIGSLHDPAKFALGEAHLPERASNAEIAVAKDARWLYEQKSRFLPGFRKVAALLRHRLLQVREYRFCHGQLCPAHVIRDLIAKMPVAVKALDPGILQLRSQGPSILSTDTRHSLQRYSLLAQLIGCDFKGLFSQASEAMDSSSAVGVVRQKTTPEVFADHKRHLLDAIKRNPTGSRTEISSMCPRAADFVRRQDPVFFNQVMPEKGVRGRASGEPGFNSWEGFDHEIYRRISILKPSLGSDAGSAASILARAGVSRWTITNAKGRLPKTKTLVLSIRKSWLQDRRFTHKAPKS